jgi:hypothetical protein
MHAWLNGSRIALDITFARPKKKARKLSLRAFRSARFNESNYFTISSSSTSNTSVA